MFDVIAAYIPHETTWEHEIVPEGELAGKEFIKLSHICELLDLICDPKI